MKAPKYLAGLMVIFMIALGAEAAPAWDTRWQFKQEAASTNKMRDRPLGHKKA